MFCHRKNERPRAWFRSDRVFSSEGRWYFSTREGIELGPWNSHAEADCQVRELRRRLEPMCPGKQSRAVICEFIFNACNTGRMLSPQFARLSTSAG